MKKIFFLLLASSIITGCSTETVTQEFNDANGENNNPDPEIYISKLEINSIQSPENNTTIFISYDTNGRVNNISDGTDAAVLVYDNGSLSQVSDAEGTFNIEELYGSPYDAFETGQVLDNDNNGNPIEVVFFEEEYDFDTNTYYTVEYTAEISYANKPNPYFYTLEAAGAIEVLDGVQLNFSLNPQVPEIVQARMLFPVNNIEQIIYRDYNNVVKYEILADYVYNDDDHPTSATITGTSFPENETSVYTIEYTYLQ